MSLSYHRAVEELLRKVFELLRSDLRRVLVVVWRTHHIQGECTELKSLWPQAREESPLSAS